MALNYGAYTWGGDIYGNEVPVVRTAFGTLSAWNALTQAQRDSFDGGHYLILKVALDAHPRGASFADHYYEAISNTENLLRIDIPATTNNTKIEINGNGFTYTSLYTSLSDLAGTTDCPQFELYNFVYKPTLKDNFFEGFIRMQSSNPSANILVHRNKLEGGGTGCLAYFFNVNANLFLFSNVCENAEMGVGAKGTFTSAFIENNTCYNMSVRGVWVENLLFYKNNNCSNCTVDIFDTGIDRGGNATSDATGSPGFQNIVATDPKYFGEFA